MRVLRILVIVALLIGAIGPLVLRPEPVDAQTPPVVVTRGREAFYDYEANDVQLWIDVWCNPEDYAGSTHMFAQYRVQGDPDWIPISGIDIDHSTAKWFTTTIPATGEAYEVRGAAVYNAAWVYGDTLVAYVPLPDEPFVGTDRAYWTSDTTANVVVYGDPQPSQGYLYAQYREQGAAAWLETGKEYVVGWTSRTFELSDLDILDTWEARAALDYNGTTIYGETVTITDYDGEDLECISQPDGAGTSGDPYCITNLCELNWMRNELDAYYELCNDIDASLTYYWDSGAGWTPVGTFTGHFDGKGFDISGLYIDRQAENNVGLFGRAANNAVIRNLVLVSPYIQGHTYCGALFGLAPDASNTVIENVHVTGGYVSGEMDIGGLIGVLWTGSATDCSYQGTVAQKELDWGGSKIGGLIGYLHNATVLRCSADVTITSESIRENIGGLIGDIYIDANVQQSFSTGTVSVTWFSQKFYSHDWRAGGFAGRIAAGASVTDSYSRAEVNVHVDTDGTRLGGFAGEMNGTLLGRVYSTGTVTGGTGTRKGGLVGYRASGTISDSFWDTQSSGQAESDGGTGKTTAEMKTKSTFDPPWDFDTIWGMDSAINDGYPNLQALSYILTVTTQAGTDIDATSFNAHGTITEAEPNAHTRGFVYMEGTTGDPTLSDDWVSQTGDFGTGAFTLNIAKLSPGTYYRVRAFAASDQEFAYGNTVTVMTTVGPTVVTLDAEHMTWQSWRERRLHGYLDNDGGMDCEVRFEYGTDPLDLNLSTSWRDRYPGGCPVRGFQTGDYFHADILMAEAELGETWYFRAQAQNTDGLSSGEVLSFTLGDEAPEEGLTVVTYDATDRTGVAFLAHGALLAADPEAFRRGFVYMVGGYGEPTLADDVVEEGGSFGPGSFSLYIEGLILGEEYRVRAFAENDDGIVYGNTLTVGALGAPVVATRTPTDIGETSFRARGEVLETGDTITRRGFVYIEGNSGTPTLTDFVVDEHGLWAEAPYSLVVTGLTGGTYYRVRAFATNDIGTGYGDTITVRTYGEPDVTTNVATHIGVSTARLHGVIEDDGGTVCQWRVEWGEASDVYTEATSWTGALQSGEAFHAEISELQPDTTYYFRAQGRNAVGLASGAELSFTTTDGIGDPSYLVATPISGTEIALQWLVGGGMDNTQIQMQQTSYPETWLHGETVYFGNESATTVTGLTPGTTYYFRAWGEGAGNYSVNYTQDMATTLAGAPDDDWPDIDEPDRWFQTPDHTGLENFPLYNQINHLFDSFGLPNTTGWVLFALLLAAIVGMLALVLSNGNVWVAMAAGSAVLVATTWMGLLMWWILLIYIVCVGAFAFIRARA